VSRVDCLATSQLSTLSENSGLFRNYIQRQVRRMTFKASRNCVTAAKTWDTM